MRHRAYRGGDRGVASSSSGFLADVVIEAGGSLFAPLQGEISSGLQLAVGSRLGPVAGLVEMQFAQSELGAQLHDINAQLRVYLPLGPNAEIYPLIAVGEAGPLGSSSASHFDLGIGAQFNLSQNVGLGVRYSARLVSDMVDGNATNGHNLTAQIALRF